MKHFFPFLVSITALLSISFIDAAENQNLKKTRWLSELDQKLFCDSKTHMVYTPYSTLSVKKFSYDKKLFIDRLDYEMLLGSALERTQQRKVLFAANIEKLTDSLSYDDSKTERQKEKQKERLRLLIKAYARAGTQLIHFERIQASTLLRTHDDKGNMRISERSLMHLLQWTYGFNHEHGPDGSNLVIKCSKDNLSCFSACEALKKFIYNAAAHEQGMKYV